MVVWCSLLTYPCPLPHVLTARFRTSVRFVPEQPHHPNVQEIRKCLQLEQNQLAVIAGDKQQEGVYQLPSQIQSAAQEQYARDIARVHGVAVQSEEAEYQDFLASLGGGRGDGRGPPPGVPPTPACEYVRHVHIHWEPALQYRCE